MDKSDFAIILSALSFGWAVGWSVFQHRTQRKRAEEEGKLRVQASFVYDPQPALKVVSTAKVPVHLTGARLIVEKGPGEQQLSLHSVVTRFGLPTEPGGTGHVVWQDMGSLAPREPLQRGEPCIFVLPRRPNEEAIKAIAWKSHPDDVSIKVDSHTGELCQLPGSEVIDFLRKLVKHWESPAADLHTPMVRFGPAELGNAGADLSGTG